MLDRNWRQTTVGPLWRHQARLLVSKTLSQSPSCSFGPHIEHIWTPFSISSGCSDIISGPDFACNVQLTTHTWRFPVHNLQIRHQSNLSITVHLSVFMITQHASHFSFEVPAFIYRHNSLRIFCSCRPSPRPLTLQYWCPCNYNPHVQHSAPHEPMRIHIRTADQWSPST